MVPRTPLRVIDGNRRRGNELSPYQRGILIGAARPGITIASLAKDARIPESTIRDTLEKSSSRNNGKTLERSGRPPILTQRASQHILRIIRTDPFVSYSGIRLQTGLTISDSTILRHLKESGYGHYRAKKRPRLTEETARIRYE
jgi:transposase